MDWTEAVARHATGRVTSTETTIEVLSLILVLACKAYKELVVLGKHVAA